MAELGINVVIYLITDESEKDLQAYCNERHQIITIATGDDLENTL